MSVMDLEHLAWVVYSVFARTCRQGRDRSGKVCPVHHETGLPLSANDLLPRSQAVTGRKLALDLMVVPRTLAASMLARGKGEDDRRSLVTFAPEEWTAEERETVDALEHRIKLIVHKAAERDRHFVTNPLGGNPYSEDEALSNDADGMTAAFKITPRGLDYALERTRGTRWELGPTSMADAVGKAIWQHAPEWARTGDGPLEVS